MCNYVRDPLRLFVVQASSPIRKTGWGTRPLKTVATRTVLKRPKNQRKKWNLSAYVASEKAAMNFNFDLNQVLAPNGVISTSSGGQSIVKVGSDLLPFGFSGHLKAMQEVQHRVSDVLDVMGQASAHAQDLRQPITSGAKLRMQDEHVVYLLVDHTGLGTVVGLLKVGKKNLFLLDNQQAQKQVYPLCVLDFYVHESRQRLGCGRTLFEAMLADQKVVHPKLLAIDRPSPKLLGFLRKHYNLTKHIHQVNNYVIFEGFFTDRPFDASPGPKRARIYMGKLQYV